MIIDNPGEDEGKEISISAADMIERLMQEVT